MFTPLRPCCQSASLQSWHAPSRPAQSHETSTLLPSSLVLELPQWVLPALELVLELFSAASSLAMPGKVIFSFNLRISKVKWISRIWGCTASRTEIKMHTWQRNGWLPPKLGCPHKSWEDPIPLGFSALPSPKDLGSLSEILLDCSPPWTWSRGGGDNPEVSGNLL